MAGGFLLEITHVGKRKAGVLYWCTLGWSDGNITSAALSWFAKFADQSVSWVDCESFSHMKALCITQAFTFDRHFDDAGFSRWVG